MFTYKTTVNWKTATFNIEILDANGSLLAKFANLKIDEANRAIKGFSAEMVKAHNIVDEEPTDEERAVAMLETLAEGGM